MKKTSMVLLSIIYSLTAFAGLGYDNDHSSSVDNYSNQHINKHTSKAKEVCVKEAYYMITEMEKILNKTDNNSNEALFNKIKTSNLWKSLNRENKEKLAENVIKWSLEGDGKIKKVKKNIANYYMEYCNKL